MNATRSELQRTIERDVQRAAEEFARAIVNDSNVQYYARKLAEAIAEGVAKAIEKAVD